MDERLVKWAGIEAERKENHPPVTPPKEKRIVFDNDENMKRIEAKRAELELKKLEIEITKLSQPNTNIDYFKQMLELQQSHNNQLMQMQQKIFDVQLQQMQNKGTDNFEQDLILEFLPMLPQILQSRNPNISKESKEVNTASAGAASPAEAIKKEVSINNMKIPNALEIEEYKKKIKSGEVTKELFYEDALKSYPAIAQKATREQIYAYYDKIKAE